MSQLPTEPDSAPKARKPLWRRIVKWTIRVIVTLLVIAAVAWAIFNYTSAKALQNEIAKIQAAGQPVTFRQLEQSQPKVEEADDAAPYYKAAIDLYRGNTGDKAYSLTDKLNELSDKNAATAPAQLAAEIEQVLADNALAMEMVDRGAMQPQCAYDLGLSNGIAVVLPPLTKSRALARLILLRTQWLTWQGRADDAAVSFTSSLRMLRIFDRQPILIAYMVKNAWTALYIDSLPTVLEVGPISDPQLAKLESVLAQSDPSRALQPVFIAERVYTLELFRYLTSHPQELATGGDVPSLPEADLLPSNFLVRPVFRMLIVRLSRVYDQYIQAAGKEWPESLDAMREACHRPSEMFALFGLPLTPTLERALVIVGEVAGSVRSAEVAVMVERYRLANGRLPASLDELHRFAGRVETVISR